jgi:ribosome-binding protein aMBF1 (putative translation factor)
VKSSQRHADNYTGRVQGGERMADFSPELLRQARELSGLSAAELGERAGLHRVTVANYERGLQCPPETWAKIERALRHALDERVRAAERLRKRLAA